MHPQTASTRLPARLTTGLALSAALLSVGPALAQQTATEIENAIDGDANIAGTEAAIGKSKIPMEGAVADTMGEALALDKATDTYETGRPLVVLKDGYEKLDLDSPTLADLSDAPVFGLDERPVGSIESMNRADSGQIEGVVVIDGANDERRRVRIRADQMSALRAVDGDEVRVYVDGDTDALAALPVAAD